jgi:hypothetical protein
MPSMKCGLPPLASGTKQSSQYYRFDIEAGQVLGRQVAEQVLATDVTRKPIPLD